MVVRIVPQEALQQQGDRTVLMRLPVPQNSLLTGCKFSKDESGAVRKMCGSLG